MEKKFDFEKQVLSGLAKCGLVLEKSGDAGGGLVLGAAVSGGADSVALLTALAALCRQNGVPLRVVTVNHNIRSEAESAGDAEFVRALCEDLAQDGADILCDIKTLPRGEVHRTAALRKGGLEEAARFLRYQIFSDFAQERGVKFICTAHTQDDNAETLLMRFLQGSGLVAPIKRVRGIYVRPLLDFSRNNIEEYLTEKKIGWRTDSTNNDTAYLRNKIRKEIVPLLNSALPSWKNAVVAGGERCAAADTFILAEAQKLKEQHAKTQNATDGSGGIYFGTAAFFAAPRAVRLRAIFLALNDLGAGGRIPHAFAEKIADFDLENFLEKKKDKSQEIATFSGIGAYFSGGEIFLKKREKVATEKVFFATIEREGEYAFPFGKISASTGGKACGVMLSLFCGEKPAGNKIEIPGLAFPFCVRSQMTGDEILDAAGKFRAVADIFSSWKVPLPLRETIPVVQDLRGTLVAILGQACGFQNWLVK